MRTLTFIKSLNINNSNNVFRKRTCIYLCARQKHYDIAIAGGGLIGTAMACSIAKNPILSEKKVVMYELFPERKLSKKTNRDEYGNRVISLNPGTREFLENLGAWKYISDSRYKAVKRMQVWDGCSDAMIVFNEDLQSDVSYIVENDVVLYALAEALKEKNNNITIEYEKKIEKVSYVNETKKVEIETANGEQCTCNLLIGAEGVKSKTREFIGKKYLNWDYDQMGIVATLKLAESTSNIVAWQKFLPTGPIALLPLTDELSSLVWSIGKKEAKELMELSDESFVDAINDAFWKDYAESQLVKNCLEQTWKTLNFLTLSSGAERQLPPSVMEVLPNSRGAFPLGFGHATNYVAPGIALVGDAAHRVHPLAGQGVNLGFADVKCLAEVLSESVYSGSRIGTLPALKSYQSKRQRFNFPVLLAIDGLQKLYGTTLPPVVAFRSVGLQVVHALHPVKNAIMKYISQ